MPATLGRPPTTASGLPSTGPADAPRRPPHLAAVAEPLSAILRTGLAAGDAGAVRQRVVDALGGLLRAERVALGWKSAGAGQWQVLITGRESVDRRSDLGRSLVAAFAETALGADVRCWNPSLAAPLAYRQLASVAGSRSIVGVALSIADRPPSAVLVAFDGGEEAESLCKAIQTDYGAALAGLCRLCDDATPARAIAAARSVRSYLAGRRKGLAMIAAAIVAAAACFPVPDRIACTATLEPSVRRFVGSPLDGKLEKALVKVGDAVVQGQTLALLDRRPLEIELSVHAAQLEEAAKRRDASRAKGQAAQAQLADLEVAQIERKIEQLEHQLGELTITSPITGIVVRGELERVEGAPLARGQNLFEIAPLSPLIAELAVPEDEVRLVRREASAAIRPLALPGASLAGRIDRLHPRAEVRDGQSIFIAEVPLPNDDGQLRPGMQAQAVVSGPRQSLAWTWLRRPVTRLYRAFWW